MTKVNSPGSFVLNRQTDGDRLGGTALPSYAKEP